MCVGGDGSFSFTFTVCGTGGIKNPDPGKEPEPDPTAAAAQHVVRSLALGTLTPASLQEAPIDELLTGMPGLSQLLLDPPSGPTKPGEQKEGKTQASPPYPSERERLVEKLIANEGALRATVAELTAQVARQQRESEVRWCPLSSG